MATKLGIDGVTFADLWSRVSKGNPCTNPDFDDQCAIRISDVLFE